MKAAKHPLKKHIIWFLFLFFIVWNYIVVLWTIKPGLCRLSRGGTLRCICPGYNNLLRFILIYLEPPEYDSEKHHSSLKYLGHGVEETGKENQIKSVHTSSRVSLFKIEFSLRQRWEVSPWQRAWCWCERARWWRSICRCRQELSVGWRIDWKLEENFTQISDTEMIICLALKTWNHRFAFKSILSSDVVALGLLQLSKSLQAPPSNWWKRENVNWGEVADEPDDADHQGHPVHNLPEESRIFRNYAKNEMFSILIYNVYQVQTPRFVNINAKQMLHDHREREYIWTNWWGMTFCLIFT